MGDLHTRGKGDNEGPMNSNGGPEGNNRWDDVASDSDGQILKWAIGE